MFGRSINFVFNNRGYIQRNKLKQYMGGILIVDAGSSKTDWSLLSEEKGAIYRYKSNGINPLHNSIEQILLNIRKVKEVIAHNKLEEIRFFGAGCVDHHVKDQIKDLLDSEWHCSKIFVESDITAAAIALFGDNEGIACVLGTGSNTALYKNSKIVSQIPSMGYILGDEGSGAALGKRLLNSFFKKQLPLEINTLFQKKYYLTYPELVKKVYQGNSPASYLSSFVSFIEENKRNNYISLLIEQEFDSFFTKNILPYNVKVATPVGFVGSIAKTFSDYIFSEGRKYNINISNIIQYPIPELEKYFLHKYNLDIEVEI